MLQGNAFLGRGNRHGALRVWAKALAASQKGLQERGQVLNFYG